ncbi:HU family DNA-binding protein [Streptomyces sp. MAG02]|nr:HU family DNA-binding protein [Streptomyces sp. MAG02]
MSTAARADGPINFGDLAALVANELDISERKACRAVAAVLNNISRTVAAGHSVTVTNFGSWRPIPTAERSARNPHTGGSVTVPASVRVAFRPSPHFTAAVRASDPGAAVIRKQPSH